MYSDTFIFKLSGSQGLFFENRFYTCRKSVQRVVILERCNVLYRSESDKIDGMRANAFIISYVFSKEKTLNAFFWKKKKFFLIFKKYPVFNLFFGNMLQSC